MHFRKGKELLVWEDHSTKLDAHASTFDGLLNHVHWEAYNDQGGDVWWIIESCVWEAYNDQGGMLSIEDLSY